MRTRLLLAAALVAGTAPAIAARPASASGVPTAGYASLVVDIDHTDERDLPQVDLDQSKVWADSASTPTVLAERTGLGRYSFTISQLNLGKGAVHLTAIHAAGAPYNEPICSIRSVSVYSTKTRIRVNCFDPWTGKAISGEHFQLFYSTWHHPVGQMVAIQSSSMYSHKPSIRYRSDGLLDRIKVKHVSRGEYNVIVPKSDLSGATFAATAISTSAKWCNVINANLEDTDFVISVECYKLGGVLSDARFALIATTNNPFNAVSPGVYSASQIVNLQGNGPAKQTFWGFNSGAGDNFAAWNTAKETTLVTFFNLPVTTLPRALLVTGSAPAVRCALDVTPYTSVFRSTQVRCSVPSGSPIQAAFIVMDTTLNGNF
jgi:hypothetical protein